MNVNGESVFGGLCPPKMLFYPPILLVTPIRLGFDSAQPPGDEESKADPSSLREPQRPQGTGSLKTRVIFPDNTHIVAF